MWSKVVRKGVKWLYMTPEKQIQKRDVRASFAIFLSLITT
jgi:hypothetical protein